MGKLNHTIEQFDNAIRKVKSDYVNVMNVDALPSDIKQGETYVNANKELKTGTLGNGSITPIASVSGSVIDSIETPYEISVVPSVSVDTAGVVTSVPSGSPITKYIKTQTRTVTPSDSEQEIYPESENFLESVTVNAASFPAILENYGVFKCKVTRPTVATSSSYRAYISAGLSHTNISCSSDYLSQAKLYLFRIGSSLNATNTVNIIDPITKDVPSTTIILTPGQSVTLTATSYSPGGTLELTSAGVVKMTYSTALICASSSYSTAPPFLAYINGYYYIAAVDAQIFNSNSTGIGSYTFSSSGYYSGSIELEAPTQISEFVNYDAPEFVFHRLGWLCYYFYWKSSSNYTRLYMYTAKTISFFKEGDS